MLGAALVLAGCGGGEDTPNDATLGDATDDTTIDAKPGDTVGDTGGDATRDTTNDVTPDRCDPGYVWTSDGCVDIDECEDGTHDCATMAVCANLPGTFSCTCLEGWEGDGVDCQDVDECTLGTHDCPNNSLCKNTDGSFECECRPGFVGDGRNCTDAAKWVAVTYLGSGLGMLDTDNMVLHGPYLKGQLGNGYTIDVAVTPDGKTALVSSFHDQFIYFVDISNVQDPVVLGNLMMPNAGGPKKGPSHYGGHMMPAGIAIDADGKYALVSGMGDLLVVIDIAAMEIINQFVLPGLEHTSIKIAPDGTIVSTGGGMGMALTSLVLMEDGTLSYVETRYLDEYGFVPGHVAIAPDGKTVLVPGIQAYNRDQDGPPIPMSEESDRDEDEPPLFAIMVFEISSPGKLVLKSVLKDIPRAVVSIAFDEAGEHAYMLGCSGRQGWWYGPMKSSEPDEVDMGYPYPSFAPEPPMPGMEEELLMVANIQAPGVVTFDPTLSASLLRYSYPQPFGVDSLVVRNDKAWIGRSGDPFMGPAKSPFMGPVKVHSVISVDLKTFQAKRIPTSGAVFGIARVPVNTTSVDVPDQTASCVGGCIEYSSSRFFTVGGFSHNQQCFCEPGCKEWGDCCEDYDDVCSTCNDEDCEGPMVCVNTEDDKFECGCPHGFVKDQEGCKEKDICGSEGGADLCSNVATCRNDPTYGYHCDCGEGPFISDGLGGCMCSPGLEQVGDTCEDIDECERGLHDCVEGSTCFNIYEGYLCYIGDEPPVPK